MICLGAGRGSAAGNATSAAGNSGSWFAVGASVTVAAASTVEMNAGKTFMRYGPIFSSPATGVL